MAETPNERTPQVGDLAAAARDRGMEKLEGALEGAKGQLAEGAERVAAAVERTADELEGEGADTISGFGRSAASLMRQLAGGLRERDVEAFARELGSLARRNPGVFLAGSVALGFGIARFFKARVPHARPADDDGWQSTGGWQDSGETRGWQGSSASDRGERDGLYSEENLDLSAAATGESGDRPRTAESGSTAAGASQAGSSYGGSATQSSGATQPSLTGEEDRAQARSRQSGKQKGKPQRASSGGAQRAGEGSSPPSNEPSTDSASGGSGSTDSAFTGGTGGGTPRGGKS